MKRTTHEDEVALGPEGKEFRESLSEGLSEKQKSTAGGKDELPRIVVLGSGNLGLVYGTQIEKRATLEEIEGFYPGLLDGLPGHEGVGDARIERHPSLRGRSRAINRHHH